ncbi:MAG: response regulator transcription factor [Chloroflexi bacterium]|nr:MAG: response regulator transcription factor [Chloroflexota bacterium]
MRLSRPTGTEEPIRLLIVDDHPVVRLGLVTLFGSARNVAVVGETGSVQEAVSLAAATQPEVILMDVRLPDGTGIDACRLIRSEHPEIKVVMLTGFADEEAVIRAVLAGANGFLLKSCSTERLVDAVETAAMGGALLDPEVTDGVLEWMRGGGQLNNDPLTRLSEQERKILPLIALGKTNRQIGEMLYLSEHTVKSYVSSLLKKLELARRSEAAAYVARHEHVPVA